MFYKKNVKVLLIGLDCVDPALVFDKWKESLPNMSALCNKGIYGNLKSTIPPITVPAWSSMFTSKDPGQLGIYGFRNRANHTYEELFFANSKQVKEKTLWNYLSINRKNSILINVPQTYPPKPLRGIMVGCFLTPNKNTTYTYPEDIKDEIERIADGNYIIDVKDFRTTEKERLLEQIYDMTNKRFKVVEEFLVKKTWDFFAFVEMGTDRIHHGFWRFMDENHRLYEQGNQFENVIKKYYEDVDSKIGKLIDIVPDGTHIFIVSDHGAQGMEGGICINEWLIRNGYLTLKEEPKEQMSLNASMIDWPKTYAWAEGGYYGRVFLNVSGREPSGIIKPEDYEKVRSEIKGKLESLGDESGKNIGTKVFIPEDTYKDLKGVPPDLIVYFGNLTWRSVGSVGTGELHVFENDTGPDDANHAENGVFIMAKKNGKVENPGWRDNLEIYDIMPTVLNLYGIKLSVDVQRDIKGKVIS